MWTPVKRDTDHRSRRVPLLLSCMEYTNDTPDCARPQVLRESSLGPCSIRTIVDNETRVNESGLSDLSDDYV